MTGPVVVADASPLIAMAAVGRLELLRALFGSVLIPPAVRREISESGSGRPGAEAVAIALAREVDAAFLLIDERRGRRRAQGLGIRVLGVLGVLKTAKAQGLVGELRPVVQALLDAGLYLGDALIADALEGE